MYVRNVAGYNFAFKYRDAVIYVPYDGKIYSIPDDSGTYRELKVVPAMHVRTQAVTYINKDGNELSYLINPKDKNTLLSLKQLYYMKGDYKKSEDVPNLI